MDVSSRVFITVLLIIVSLRQARADGGGYVAGRSCGVDTPFRIKKKLNEGDTPEENPCTIVKDRKSFKKYIQAVMEGTYYLITP